MGRPTHGATSAASWVNYVTTRIGGQGPSPSRGSAGAPGLRWARGAGARTARCVRCRDAAQIPPDARGTLRISGGIRSAGKPGVQVGAPARPGDRPKRTGGCRSSGLVVASRAAGGQGPRWRTWHMAGSLVTNDRLGLKPQMSQDVGRGRGAGHPLVVTGPSHRTSPSTTSSVGLIPIRRATAADAPWSGWI